MEGGKEITGGGERGTEARVKYGQHGYDKLAVG